MLGVDALSPALGAAGNYLERTWEPYVCMTEAPLSRLGDSGRSFTEPRILELARASRVTRVGAAVRRISWRRTSAMIMPRAGLHTTSSSERRMYRNREGQMRQMTLAKE